ncbi:LCP family protein [Microbacterium jiangjiandongii]|uniref:LCP family protein n=1 Tax=Microbacterium jiangjiandongii TaxID=3049071 RepID=UPI00214B0D4C|nr:LCP family protein [Microbacterium sp. zg.Y843]MCR2815020.1 LCP family protein [Microbacterium sp. zg.Y843]
MTGRGDPTRGRRLPVARHGVLRQPHPLMQVLTVLGVMAAVVVVSAASVAGYAAVGLVTDFAANSVALDDEPAEPPSLGPLPGPITMVVTGTDECEEEIADSFGGRCKGADAAGKLNDVNLLVHISDAPRRVTVVSFPRDLMVPIPSCTSEDGTIAPALRKQQLNAAYGHGGLGCVVDTLSELSGLSVPYAAKVTFGNVINITDAIGGVDVCIAGGGIRDRHTGIDWPAGMRTVSGFEALQFLRTRHGVGDGSDLGRISNQQQYMSRLVRKLVSDEVLTDVGTLGKLAGTAVNNVTPSDSLANPVRLVQIALAAKDVPFDDITFLQYPTLEDPYDMARVVPDYDAAEQLWDALVANQPLQLTGEAGKNDAVVVVEPPTAGAPTDPPADGADPGAGETPVDPAPPAEGTVVLPESITGSTAAQETCSVGNVGE